MKKILTLLLLVIAVQVLGQTYPVTGITISLPANPDANTANWGSGTSLFTITANAKAANGRVDGRIQESKILVIIKKGGAKICGSYTGNTAPGSNFNTLTKVWSGSNAVSLLGQNCTLPPGDYELCVQFFGTGPAGFAPLSEEKTKPFSIKAKEQLSYQPPQAISPANGTVLSEIDTKKPITFRWTPVIPRPQEPVTYRLKVWQLMQGQNGAQAMATNQPIITKDVDNLTQTIITNLISAPCLAPYLCDYIWNVQALDREGKPIGGNNGLSESFTLTIRGGSICGMKFNDLNGNGIKDNNEPGIPGWEINLGGPADLSVKTDERGNYCFGNLKPGEYIIKEEIRSGWIQVAPANGHFKVTLKEGQNIVERNFGNKVDPCAAKAWKPVGEGMNQPVFALSVMNGKLFAGGFFTTAGGVPANRIAKWDGMNWSPLGIGIDNGFVNSFATMGTDLFVGGEFLSAGGIPSTYAIAKWDEVGTTWSALGAGLNSWPYALSVSNQQLYVKGLFTLAGGLPRNNIARWDGTNWLPLGSGINNSGFYSALASVGPTLYVGGSFTAAGGVNANNIAKWTGTSWSPLGSGVNSGVSVIVEMGGAIYAGGSFTTAGGISANRIAKWNGTSWSPLSSGINGEVMALAVIGSDLYVGGDFSTAGGITVNGIAKWDGTNWSALGIGMSIPYGVNSYVNTLAVIGNELYAGGSFSTAGGIPALNIAKYTCDESPIITPETSCDCAEKPWGAGQKVTSTDGTKPYIQEIGCGGKLTNKIVAGSILKYTNTPYACSTGHCKVTYDWKIVNATGGAIVGNGTALSLPVDFTAPTTDGDYRLIITPICSAKPCRPCDFYFSVSTPVVKNCITPPPGMVGWWSGDGTTSDLSGFGNHGVLLGGTSFTAGKVDKAFRTTINTQTISIADNPMLNFGTGSLSIDAWVKTKDATSRLYIANKYIMTGLWSSVSSTGYTFYIQQGKLHFSMMQGTTSINQVVPNVLVNDGNWHFVAVSVDRTSTTGGKIYIDGNVVLTFNPTTVPNAITNTLPLIIGGSPFNGSGTVNPNFEYLIDEVELFNRALSESEMKSIFDAGVDGKCKPVTATTGNICGMKFHDLNGDGIKDSNEPGIAGWQISLGGPVDRSVKTDKDGNYCFNELKPGQYIIKEEQKEGWQQTTPTTGHFEINMYTGQNYLGKDFGNKADSCRAGLKPKTWSSLGTGINGTVLDIVVKGTDVYAGGDFTLAGGVPANHIAKWNGTSWSGLATGVNGQVNALARIGTDIYVGGNFTLAGGIAANNIAKWNGTGWTALGNGFNGDVHTLSVIGGELYAGGLYTIAGNVSANNIAKWNGTAWTPLSSGTGVSSGGYQAVSAAGVNGSSLYAGGLFLTAGGVTVNHVGKWNGTSWSSLGSGITTIAGMGIYEFANIGTDLYVAGYFDNAGGVSVANIAKWNGSSWAPLASGVNLNIEGMAALGTDIYVGGNFTTAGGAPANHLARWNGTAWAAIGTGTDGIMYTMRANGHDLYVGGTFTTVDGVTATNIAKYSCNVDPASACSCTNQDWDAMQNVTTNDGRNPSMQELKCSGRLTSKVKTSSIIKYNAPVYNCATADCKATYEWKIVNMQGGATVRAGVVSAFPANFMAPDQVGDYQLIITPICGTKICAPCGFYFSTIRGEFGSINGVKFNDLNGNGVRDTNDEGMADWEITLSGPIDKSVKTNSNGEYSFTDLVAGQYLIKEETLPGWHQKAPSTGDYNITLQTGFDIFDKDFGNQLTPCKIKEWAPLGTGVNGKVYAMARMGTDLYVGGSFTMAGGVPAKNIAKWNGTQWSALGSGVNGNSVNAITVVGTDVYVGGKFVTAGGVTTNNIAKWNGTSWIALGSGVSANGGSAMVEDIKVIDGNLYAGGSFASAGGVSANNIAKWNGSSWFALGTGFKSVVRAITKMGDFIYVGGYVVTGYGNNPTSSIYKWDGTTWLWAITSYSVYEAVDAFLVKGPKLYIGGWFNKSYNEVTGANYVAVSNGLNFSSVGTGTNGHLDALVTIGADIYAGGNFTTAGGVTAKGVARWNGANWSAIGGGIPGHVEALTVIGGDLYAGGDFTTAGGKSANYVAKYGCSINVIINTDKKKK